MASTRRFVCCVPGRSYPACSFEQELSVDVISRSLVLQNALAVVDDDCAAALVLPDGSDRTFFHAWLQYCEQAGWRGHEKTPEELVNALRAADFFADCEVCGLPSRAPCKARLRDSTHPILSCFCCLLHCSPSIE